MPKESKTVSTIRRRKGKDVALALQKIKEENAPPPPATVIASDAEIQSADKEDKCYMFDDRVLGPLTLRRLMSQPRSLFLALFAIRCANALLIQTQHVPDEFWQSLEVAHKMVFGYGYLTWEWREGLRGYSYPLVFSLGYKFLQFFSLDSRLLLIKVPRLIQAGIAGFGDYHLYKLSSRLAGRSAAQWTLLCQLLSWFTIYCSTRTLSNSTEASLMIVALSYFPWPPNPQVKESNVRLYLVYAALSVIVRPTAALVWILLCCWHLQLSHNKPGFGSVVRSYLVVGLSTFFGSALIDRIWYGRWTFVQLNFLMFNVVRGGASIYGTHPWHWYLWQGFPVVMGTLIFPFAVGAWRAKDKTLLWIIIFIVATHSFLPHKEFRFILPAVPLAMHYCGLYFQQLCTKPSLKEIKAKLKPSEAETKDPPTPEKAEEESRAGDGGDGQSGQSENNEVEEEKEEKDEKGDDMSMKEVEAVVRNISELVEKELKSEEKSVEVQKTYDPQELQEKEHKVRLGKARILIGILALTNLLPAFYFCLIHQRGTIMVTKFLADITASAPPGKANFLFLMPCHSVPYYSYLHANVTMRFLNCDPPGVSGSPTTSGLDEADRFFENPEAWLRKEYGGQGGLPWPSQLIFFSDLRQEISGTLIQAGYKLCANYFHTHFPEGRVGSSVLVACR